MGTGAQTKLARVHGCWAGCSEERVASVRHAPSHALGVLEGQLDGAGGI